MHHFYIIQSQYSFSFKDSFQGQRYRVDYRRMFRMALTRAPDTVYRLHFQLGFGKKILPVIYNIIETLSELSAKKIIVCRS